ncbi:MAG: DUF1295 domain-containing protein [Nitrospirales bacterium]|nr:DUF1295 domain-containing protein [Nitrospira sp.]MDR4501692.1 DUF1295 domain-containing protein [Nitrospirales bacterium]
MTVLSSFVNTLVQVWLCAAFLMFWLWIIQNFYRNAVVADIGFCVMFGVLSIVYAVGLPGDPVRKGLLGMMGAVYGFRLASHLTLDRLYKKAEDARYQTLREAMGAWAQSGFFLYFQGQAVALAVFSIPLLILMVNPFPPFSLWEVIGIFCWVFAIAGEASADYQLRRFRMNPSHVGKTCRVGWWYYCRHPNYFFEGCIWSSYVVMAIGIPWGWLTVIGPLGMMIALLKVSGIPYAEARAIVTRGDDYRDYQRTTNALIPWFPKSS